MHEKLQKSAHGSPSALKNEWTILLVTRYLQDSDHSGRWYKDSKTHSISQENSQEIAVIDPRTPKKAGKPPVYDPRPRFLIFSA